MELALSVGSEATRKREVYCASGDRFRHGYPLTENVIQEGGGCGGSRKCPPIQLDLKLSWSSDDTGTNYEGESRGGLDVNQAPARKDRETDVGASSSESHPTAGRKHNWEADVDRASSRCSDEEEAGSTRKKLRLSKEQSCYLEESFKEHPTLNTKQKLALAKQLNLRPRQVEVWFQNRRARTKLKQTEVDCEYLKRCCESLTEENRRLHKELQDLKALKIPTNPFRMHVPATTLTMCPACEQILAAAPPPVTDTAAAAVPGGNQNQKNPSFGIPKSRFCPP
ncbi:homeobox-leucine zipper protein HOX11-like [Aristolochia californica]|uniref:homeobox-leucine zipper protein HOX11-like n=1 Tax=Aristolochia californica TaxID=171875 RepID=UPI0035D875AD